MQNNNQCSELFEKESMMTQKKIDNNVQSNLFFFTDINTINQYTYRGTVWGENVLDEKNENVDEEGGVFVKSDLTITQVASLSEGNVYKLDFAVKGEKNGTVEKDEKLYLWVTEDKIYYLSPPRGANDNSLYENGQFNYLKYAKKLEQNDELPSNDKKLILCSNDNMSFINGAWETEINVNDNICTYITSNEGNFSYKKLVWEVGKGLIEYSWGYGARKAGMDLHLTD